MEIFGNLVNLDIYKYISIANYYILPMIQYFSAMQRLFVSVVEDDHEKDARFKGDAWVWTEFQEWWERLQGNSTIAMTAKSLDGKKHKEATGKKKTHAMKLKFGESTDKKGSNSSFANVGVGSGDSSSDALMNENKKALLPSSLTNTSSIRTFLYTTIRLSECSINDAQFSILVQNSPVLTKLVLRKCILLTAMSMDLLKNCNITDLQFQAVPFASDECVARIIAGIGTRDSRCLAKFKFQSQNANPKLICAAIGSHCQNLKSLILSETKACLGFVSLRFFFFFQLAIFLMLVIYSRSIYLFLSSFLQLGH
jgi:hypothetical protein